MYRTSAKRTQHAATWTLSAVLAVGAGVTAAKLVARHNPAPVTAAGSSSRAGTARTASAPATVSTSASLVRTAALSVSPTARTIVAVSANSLTVSSAAGTSTYTLGPSSVVMSGKLTISRSSLRVGERVIVVPSTSNPSLAVSVGILPSTSHEAEGSVSSDH